MPSVVHFPAPCTLEKVLPYENPSKNQDASLPERSSHRLPSFEIKLSGQDATFLLSGSWTVDLLSEVEKNLSNTVKKNVATKVFFDLSLVSTLDTAGALLINRAADRLGQRGVKTALKGVSPVQGLLLEQGVLPAEDDNFGQTPSSILLFANAVGRRLYESARSALELMSFFGQFLVLIAHLFLRPARLRVTSLVFHMEQTGLRAVPIVSLLTFLIGLVVAYMGAEQLRQVGMQTMAVNLLEVSIMREMGVLITAIVVAGRSSSSFTAQIGSMVANEEVAAIKSMGLDPMNLLVAPRVLALVVTLPILVFIADLMALLGGALALLFTIDLSLASFISQYYEAAYLTNFLSGIIKAPFFALIIGIVGCFHGFKATSSAESVGFLTTISVVQAIFLVILADALFAIFFTTIGI